MARGWCQGCVSSRPVGASLSIWELFVVASIVIVVGVVVVIGIRVAIVRKKKLLSSP